MRIQPGTRAVITGASRGIGRALAAELARRGARLGLVARGKDGLHEVAGELPESPFGPHATAAADVSRWGQTSRAIERLAKNLGGIDLLVVNAGVLDYAPFLEQELEQAERMVHVNVLGAIYTLRAALPRMLEGPAGHVVVMSSAAGLRSFPWGAVYGATKAAERGLAEALRHELAGTGISVTTVYAGEHGTTILDHQRDRLPAWRANEAERPVSELVAGVIKGIEQDARAVYAPPAVRILGLNGVAPRLTDRLLARVRGRAAAPRLD
jgi:3-oxoacyl-[acyl-carrier protein] reductase